MRNLITLATDSFHRPNENPVDPTMWSANNNELPCQIINNRLVCNNTTGSTGPHGDDKESTAIYTGISWPNNQWAQLQIDALGSGPNSGVVLAMRSGGPNGYIFEIDGPFSPKTAITLYTLVDGVVANIFLETLVSLKPGVIIRTEVMDSAIEYFINGRSLGKFNDVALTSGSPDIALFYDNAVTDTQVSRFRGGECR